MGFRVRLFNFGVFVQFCSYGMYFDFYNTSQKEESVIFVIFLVHRIKER